MSEAIKRKMCDDTHVSKKIKTYALGINSENFERVPEELKTKKMCLDMVKENPWCWNMYQMNSRHRKCVIH